MYAQAAPTSALYGYVGDVYLHTGIVSEGVWLYVLLVTGLCNLQTIRTAEMAEVSYILFVRGKKVTPDMLELARENNMVLLETDHSMYHTVGELYSAGLLPIY